MKPNFATGQVIGTGAAINVQLGWLPDYVKVFNPNDAGSLWPTMEWGNGMGAGKGFKTLKAVDSGATGNASSAFVATNGISQYAGDGTHNQGFTIGADGDINVSGEGLVWIAMRGV